MLAVINQQNYEEVEYDLNCMVFNVIEPKSQARVVWAEVEDYLYNGASEEFLYRLVEERIKDNKD